MAISFFGSGRPTDTDPSHFAALAQVRAYWEGLREGPTLPRRDQIDPRGIAGALEYAFVLERIAPGIARFRLAGMHIVDLMGMEVRGMPLSALFDPAGRSALGIALEKVFTAPAILDLHLEAERSIGKPALSARMMILPLLGNSNAPDMALGCLISRGDVGRSPRRFAVSNLMLDTLPGKANPTAQKMQHELAEAPVPYQVQPTAKGRSYLQLVKLD